MEILRTLTECEIEYLKCFCKAEENEKYIRFRDDELLYDMRATNYTWIKNTDNDTDLLRLIESEIEYSKHLDKDFCMISCHIPVNITALKQLSAHPDISTSGWYVFDCAKKIPQITKNDDLQIIRANNPKLLDDILSLDLENEGENPDIDFCTRRITRRKNIYLSDKGVDSYICYYKGNPVGNCDLFVYNGAAKIEEFAVTPKNRGKGFGSALLNMMMETALTNGANYIYLCPDESNSVKEMYQKFGFNKVHRFTELEFSL